MSNISFTFDFTALGILFVGCLIAYLIKRHFSKVPPPHLLYSDLKELKKAAQGQRKLWPVLPKRLYQATILFFALAFIDPHFLIKKTENPESNPQKLPSEGIAIYLDLDQSGSMTEKVRARDADGNLVSISKVDLLKQVTKQFIMERPNDLIGMVSFARVPHILAPLTLDKEVLLGKLSQIEIAKTPEDDGTAMGYAIYKTAHLIAATKHFAETLQEQERPAYEIKNTIIIVVTDGFQDPNYLDKGNRLRTIELDEAAAYAKSQNIKLYVVNVDPAMGSDEFGPQRRQLERITRTTGGQFFLVDDNDDLQKIYGTINQLEKEALYSATTNPNILYQRFSLYPLFLILAMLCFLCAVLLETTLLRRIP